MARKYKQYEYIPPGFHGKYGINPGSIGTGEAVGVIVLNSQIPCPPGHITNAWTFDFPVHYLQVDEAGLDEVVNKGDQSIVEAIIKGAKQLELDGCRAIMADCGYFGHYQKQIAASVDVPVYMSGVIQASWIAIALKPDQKVGIICANKDGISDQMFEACGVSEEVRKRCVVRGAGAKPEFEKLLADYGELDFEIIKNEVVEIAVEMTTEHPEIGAILLECTDMSPYSYAVQAAVNLPVYDAVTLLKYVNSVVTHRPYGGFIGG